MMRASVISRQGGVVLIVSLLVLLLLAVLATAVSQVNLLQLRMAANDHARVAALQQSLAVVDVVLARPGSTPLTGGVGYRICAVDTDDPGCDESTLEIDSRVMPVLGSLDYGVIRVGPALSRMAVMSEHEASSGVYYRAARFEVGVSYDAVAQGLGQASLTQGVLVRLAVPVSLVEGL